MLNLATLDLTAISISITIFWQVVRYYFASFCDFVCKTEFFKKLLRVRNMVRTKGDRVPTKAMGSKAARKIQAATPGKKSNGKKNAGGGNPYHPRQTPEWQKPITSFMNTSSKTTTDNENNKESSVKEENIENQALNFKDPNAEESSTEDDNDDDEEEEETD